MKGGDTEEVRQHRRRSGKTVEQMQLETKLESLRDRREPGDSESIALPTQRVTLGPGQVSSVHVQRKGNKVTLTLTSLKAAKELLLSFCSRSFFLFQLPFSFSFPLYRSGLSQPSLWFRLPENYNSHIPASLAL